MTTLAAAQQYATDLSLPVFPLRAGGKAPATEHGFKDATRDVEVIRRWFRERSTLNLGAPVPKGYVVVDVDSPEARRALAAQDLDFPTTVTAKTPRGWHYWYRCPGLEIRPKVGVFPGVDLRGTGSYVVFPPSRLAKGAVYRWEVEPKTAHYAEAPDWLLELATAPGLVVDDGDKAGIEPALVLSGIAEGSRDVTLFRYACRLRARGYDREEAEVLVAHAASACDPPFPRGQALRKVEQAWKYEGPEEPEPAEGQIWDVRHLMETDLPGPSWLVPPILGEGLTLLVSPPKAGKSFLMGSICYAVSTGGGCLGAFQAEEAGVLYLDLEQTPHQAKTRWQRILDGEPPPKRLFTAFEWPRMDHGGLDRLDAFLDEHPGIRLVVIDVLSRFWPERSKHDGGNAYHWETRVLADMKRLAEEKGIALVLVHHTNRANPTDPLAKVSGTTAMTGVPGAILILGRKRGTSEGTLYVTGRTVEERTIDMTFNPNLRGWTAKDPLIGRRWSPHGSMPL